MSKPQENVGRVSTRQATSAHGDVGLRPSVVSLSNQETANPTYGGMAANWKDITLGDFVALQRGHDLTEPERRPGHVPVIGSAGQNGFHDTSLAKGPGIVIGRSGASFGQVHFCATDYWPHNTGLYVTDFKGNDPRFAYYFFKALDFDRYNSGSAQPSLNRNFIYPIPICVPEPDEQKTIAHILGTLDDKIELNRRMNATLEAMARALFQSWFVDFEPVRAKLDGRKPAGLDAATAALFPAHFQDSPLGHIPQGWKLGVLNDLIDTVVGGDWGSSEPSNEENLPTFCIRGADIPSLQEGGIGKMPTRFLKRSSLEKRSLSGGDLAIEISGGSPTQSTGRPVLVTENLLQRLKYPLVCSNFCRIVKLKSPATSKFVYLWLRLVYENGEIFQFENGTTGIKNFAFTLFAEKNPLVIPPPELCEAFDRVVSPLLEQHQANGIQSSTLSTLRDTLLPKLLSGKLSVAKATSELEAVT